MDLPAALFGKIGIDAFCAVAAENGQLKFISLLDTVRPLLFDNSARLLQKSRAASDSLFYRGAAFREAIVQKERNAQMPQIRRIAGHRSHLPETFHPAARGRNVASTRQTPAGRLDAGNPAEMRRQTHASRRIAPQSQRRTTGRDQSRLASAAAA